MSNHEKKISDDELESDVESLSSVATYYSFTEDYYSDSEIVINRQNYTSSPSSSSSSSSEKIKDENVSQSDSGSDESAGRMLKK